MAAVVAMANTPTPAAMANTVRKRVAVEVSCTSVLRRLMPAAAPIWLVMFSSPVPTPRSRSPIASVRAAMIGGRENPEPAPAAATPATTAGSHSVTAPIPTATRPTVTSALPVTTIVLPPWRATSRPATLAPIENAIGRGTMSSEMAVVSKSNTAANINDVSTRPAM